LAAAQGTEKEAPREPLRARAARRGASATPAGREPQAGPALAPAHTHTHPVPLSSAHSPPPNPATSTPATSASEALETFSPRQLRLMFALAPWDRRIAYGARAREEVRAWEASLKNFFANVEVGLRRGAPGAAAQRWGAAEAALQGALAAAQAAAHARLLDSVDTRGALDAVAELVLAANKYLAARADAAGPPPQAFLLRACAAFATKVLSAMGLAPAAADALGLGDGGGGGGGGAADGRAAGALDALAAFRDEVRALARAGAPPAALLAASDALRDGPMVALGVRLEDLPDGSSVWKPDDPAALRAEFAARRAAAAAAAAKKVRTKAEAARREVDKLEKLAALGSVEAALADKYSRFDAESGDPTHDAAGAPLEGKAADKARKEAEKQRKARAPLAKRLAEEGPGALDALRAAAAALEGELAALELGGAGA
jgi:cysteinyl-tRNA synthetase